MEEQQNHLSQLVEQRAKLASDLETLGNQSTRTRELFLKTQGAIEYLKQSESNCQNQNPKQKQQRLRL